MRLSTYLYDLHAWSCGGGGRRRSKITIEITVKRHDCDEILFICNVVITDADGGHVLKLWWNRCARKANMSCIIHVRGVREHVWMVYGYNQIYICTWRMLIDMVIINVFVKIENVWEWESLYRYVSFIVYDKHDVPPIDYYYSYRTTLIIVWNTDD